MSGLSPRSWTRLGVGGAVAVYLSLGLMWTLAVPLFLPADESAHVDYASQVAHGHLPVAGTTFQAEFPDLGQQSGVQYVAYHPPMYYWLVGRLVRLADDDAHPVILLLAVRCVGIALTMVTVVMVAVLAARVFADWAPARRAQVSVLAAGLVAAVPSVVGATASIQNDALELVMVAIAGVLLAGVVRHGATAVRIILLGVVCGLGMLSRVTFAQVLLVALLTAAAVILLRDRDRPVVARLTSAARSVGPIALLPVAMAGWFYLKNHDRYGSFTGSNVAYGLVSYRGLSPRMSSPIHYVLSPFSWWAQLLQLGGVPAGQVSGPGTVPKVIGVVLLVLAGVGVAAVIRRWPDFRPNRDGVILLSGLLLVLLISFAEIASHVSHKGSENNRYLIDALPFWGIAFGWLLLAIGPRRFPMAAFAVVVAEIVGTLNFILIIVRRQSITDLDDAPRALITSMSSAGVAHPALLLAILAAILCAGLAAQFVAISILGSPRIDRPPSAGRHRSQVRRPARA